MGQDPRLTQLTQFVQDDMKSFMPVLTPESTLEARLQRLEEWIERQEKQKGARSRLKEMGFKFLE